MKRFAFLASVLLALGVAGGAAWWLSSGPAPGIVEPETEVGLGRAQGLLDFDGLEVPADALLQPGEAPEAHAFDALKPVEARERSLPLPAPERLARRDARAPAVAAPPDPASGGPHLVVALDSAQVERARALAAAMELRPPAQAGEPGRPGGRSETPQTVEFLGNEPPPPLESSDASSAPRSIAPPSGYGVWSQSPPPARGEGDRQ